MPIALKAIPVWVFHGDADNVLLLLQSAEMVMALKAVRGNVKLTVYTVSATTHGRKPIIIPNSTKGFESSTKDLTVLYNEASKVRL